MGLFDKIKSAIQSKKEQVAQKQEEEKRRQEEEKRKREEANRLNPDGKNLEWFCSEDGLKAFGEYITVQNYILEETIKKEKEEKYREYSLDVVVSVFYKDAKIPYYYFKKLISNIKAQALDYVGPINLLVRVLSTQAKPFYFDEDGEPQIKNSDLTPEEIVSVEKNPVLNFVSNFNCFELKDDTQGSWDDKWQLWSDILIWLGVYGDLDKDIISNNPWIFSSDVYFNNLGTVRKPKAFYKKCLELASNKEFFEHKLSELE